MAAPDPTALKVLALDVDGTIAGDDRMISPRTEKTLRQVAARGIEPVLVTGRRRAVAVSNARAVGSTRYCVSTNGAVIVDLGSGEDVRCITMTADEVETLRSLAAGRDVTPVYWTVTAMRAHRDFPARDQLEAANGETIEIAPTDDIRAEDVVKITLAGEPGPLDEAMAAVGDRLPNLERAEEHFSDMCPAAVSKWEALEWVLNQLGVAPEHVLGFADGQTDAEWITTIGHGVAMGNALDSLKEVADEVIGRNAEEAVAAYLEDLLDLPRPGR